MLNSVRARPKKSTLEKDTGRGVLITFSILLSICLISGLSYSIWDSSNSSTLTKYMMKSSKSFFTNFITRMGNWLLIFGNFVPISLLLTLETVKFLQGKLMAIDKGLLSANGIGCGVQSSNMNEELGQIDYVFSDKTGTLTCNEMRFKYLIVGAEAYGMKRGYEGEVPYVKNVDFEDPRVWQIRDQGFATKDCRRLRDAIVFLGLCHSVVLEIDGDYNASSPDELAFVNFAKLVGCEFKGTSEDNYIMIKEFDENKKYKMLEVIDFNSTRKRMSCIVRTPEGKIFMYCKGADSIMIPRYSEDKKENFNQTMDHIDRFAKMGLRTLLLGQKEMTESEYSQFKQEYDGAKNNLDRRYQSMSEVEDKWENGFTLIGGTAIEDKLQDEVRKGS